MNTKMGVLVGGLALFLSTTASATSTSFVECGSVGTASGSVLFTTSDSAYGGGSATTSGGNGIITCNGFAADGFTLPAGDTLVGISVVVGDDAQDPLNSSSQITWNWSYTSGDLLSPVPTGTNHETAGGTAPFFSFSSCAGTGTLVCNVDEGFGFVNPYNGTNGFTFQVNPSVTGGGLPGVSGSGNASAEVDIAFTYVSTSSIPEPASLLLMGTGLIGLGVFARRKRRKS